MPLTNYHNPLREKLDALERERKEVLECLERAKKQEKEQAKDRQKNNIKKSSAWMRRAQENHLLAQLSVSLKTNCWLSHDFVAALSLEQAGKAIISTFAPDDLIENKYGHRLTEIFDKAKVDLSDLQKATLRYLEASFKWWARYPAPIGKCPQKAYNELEDAHTQLSDKELAEITSIYEEIFQATLTRFKEVYGDVFIPNGMLTIDFVLQQYLHEQKK